MSILEERYRQRESLPKNGGDSEENAVYVGDQVLCVLVDDGGDIYSVTVRRVV
jgi:hypothetical protein